MSALDALISNCNKTELYQLCVNAGLVVSPRLTREELAKTLLGEQDEYIENSLDPWRHGIADFVLSHWQRLQNQITCPLKSKDPLSCFGCLDTQVVACLNDNAPHLHAIQLLKKTRK